MQRWALATCATAINILFTALTAGILHRYAQHSALNVATYTTAHVSSLSLSLHALGNAHHAALATLLFTVNPASVFFTAPYTEATFALLSMAGMLCWVRATPQRPTPWLAAAAVLFAAATATRSNGLLHCGFFAHSVLQAVAAAAQRRCSWTAAMALLAACAACCLVTVAPLVALQAHATMVMCAAAEQGGPAASWCGSVWELLWSPAMYRAVQARYWDVGFLRSYRPTQLPNVTCGLLHGRALSKARDAYTACMLQPVFLWQWVGMAAVALLFMHVHVVTRFVSSCPALYWWAAAVLLRGGQRACHALATWWLGYALIGAAAFPNFLPWC